ncbi:MULTISPECIES: c-type cytochrome [Rhodanobacter]|uniref:c-type cytochrome n=1 Tax=Rhodanobacter TaxID=75309 RepID=UPI000483AB51|nr:MULTISPECIES: c-type cytochrome [Rhodanobacter]UJJ59863.1 cytochrome c4 [Rhodanobacter denitrificans]
MSFRSAGFRPTVLGSALALVLALSASAVMAQDAKPETATPAAVSTAATPAGAATAAAPAPAATAAAAKPGDATAGQAKAAVCGACHGMDGNSTNAQFPKLAGQSEQYIVRQLTSFKAAKRQNPIMMGMAAPLSEQDMHDLGAYFASKTALPGVADQALVERGQTLFRQGDAARGIPACMACHSIDGRGNPGAIYPQLASQHAQYIEATLKAWHDGTTWGDDARAQVMPAIAKQLSADDIAALASYIEGLHSADSQPASAP